MVSSVLRSGWLLSLFLGCCLVSPSHALDPQKTPDSPSGKTEAKAEAKEEEAEDVDQHPLFKKVTEAFKDPEGAKRMLDPKKGRLWVHPQKKEVILDGYVALDKGPLELFACTSGTKEHEAVIAVYSPARYVHAALLAAGANPGHPVQHTPQYTPALGQRIEIQLQWKDDKANLKTANAKEWVRYFESKKPLTSDWVFAGSGWWTDDVTKRQYYMADSGDVICVSNFTSAMLDLPIESSAENANLAFEAWEGKVPPRYTPVRLVLKPLPDRIPKKETAPKAEEKPTDEPKVDNEPKVEKKPTATSKPDTSDK